MKLIDEAIVEEVRRRLDQVEASEEVRILLAVESGSRGLGTEKALAGGAEGEGRVARGSP